MCFFLIVSCGGGNKDTPSNIEPPTGPIAEWSVPDCGFVSGTGAVSFTVNGGQDFVENTVPLSNQAPQTTRALIAIGGAPNRILAVHESDVLESIDAGCSWTTIAQVADPAITFAESSDGEVFGLSSNDGTIYHYSVEDGFSIRGQISSAGVRGFGVLLSSAEILRAVSRDGDVLESQDGGRTWRSIAQVPNMQIVSIINHAIVDPIDVNHIFVSKVREAYQTTDGGQSWLKATGFESTWSDYNVVHAEVSSLDSNIVWAAAFDLSVPPDMSTTGERGIFVSFDGGASFTLALDTSESGRIRLDALPIFKTSLFEADAIHIVQTQVADQCSTDVGWYVFSSNSLVTNRSNTIPSAGAIAPSPVSEDILYVGLEQRINCL